MRRLDADFDDFVLGRSPALLRTAALLVGDRHEAEDLLQTALLRLARHWSRAVENPDAYVRRVMVNLACDHSRRRRRRPVQLGSVPDVPVGDASNDDHDDLVQALRDLPERQRATVVLRFWEDLSVAETAAILGCTEGTVKSTTSKALAHLRAAIQIPQLATAIGADDVH
ncbi:MAG: SigE family RNA polymerase sigma factor [Frankiaceae bacterium]|nr:SigE family RNA polymerase sigma factor [Frankiaceae bacterium]MBV9872134.1 SigE family RNA polymerase sigma factor [Frankiaceae bacterium]